MDRSEEKLIKDIVKRNDSQAASQLTEKYYREVYAFLYVKTGNMHDAMDLVQETFIAALRSLPSFDIRKASFRTWLHHIAFHKFIDSTRRRIPVSLEECDIETVEEEDVLKKIMDRDLLERIDAFVSAKDTLSQEIWYLHIYQDAPFREIAVLTGMKEQSVKTRYYRLQKEIRKEFGDDYGKEYSISG